MMDILVKSMARAGGIETAADLRIVPAPRPAADHTAILLAALGRGSRSLANMLERGARHLEAKRTAQAHRT